LERGRVQVSASDLLLIAAAVEKPIAYFFPPVVHGADANRLTPEEQEPVYLYRKLQHKALQLVAIDQLRTLADSAVKADLEAMRREIESEKQTQK
jgi:hypothetical protein